MVLSLPHLGKNSVALAIGLASVTACNSVVSMDDDSFFFPRQKAGVAAMDALAIGKLELVGQCLVVDNPVEEMPVVIVWPADFAYEGADGSITVLDGDGNPVVRVGDEIYMGGGQIRSLDGIQELISDDMRRDLKERCPGIYWFAGSDVRLATDPV